MFDNKPADMCVTLTEMYRAAYARSNCNRVEAAEKMKEYLAHDTRFNTYDPDRLVARAIECRHNGATLRLDDPYLQRGGQKRPLSW
jgi:hypothetical protein